MGRNWPSEATMTLHGYRGDPEAIQALEVSTFLFTKRDISMDVCVLSSSHSACVCVCVSCNLLRKTKQRSVDSFSTSQCEMMSNNVTHISVVKIGLSKCIKHDQIAQTLMGLAGACSWWPFGTSKKWTGQALCPVQAGWISPTWFNVGKATINQSYVDAL